MLGRVRRVLLALVALGLIGTAAELALMAHNEDTNQLIPFVAIAVALAAIAWRVISRSTASAIAVQLTMVVLIGVALLGVTLHYQANMEFQLEMDRSLRGLALMGKVLEAKAPPALAPANMALLGLFGLLSVYGGSRNDA